MGEKVVDSIKNPNYPIQPENIDTSVNLDDAFIDHRTSCMVRCLIMFFQHLGGWEPLSRQEIERFEACQKSISLDYLMNLKLIIKGDDQKFRLTHNVVSRSFLFHPAI